MASAAPVNELLPKVSPPQVLAPSEPEVLYARHEGLAERVVAKFLARYRASVGVRSVERDDLLQEARIALWSACERCDPERLSAFEAFARLTIVGALLHALRDAGEASSTCSLTPADVDALSEPSHASSVEARVTLAQLLRLLHPRERQAIEMHYLRGETKAAVGEALGVTPTHASRILLSSMHKLQILAGA